MRGGIKEFVSRLVDIGIWDSVGSPLSTLSIKKERKLKNYSTGIGEDNFLPERRAFRYLDIEEELVRRRKKKEKRKIKPFDMGSVGGVLFWVVVLCCLVWGLGVIGYRVGIEEGGIVRDILDMFSYIV